MLKVKHFTRLSLVATETGGQVLETSKAQVTDVVKVIDPAGSSNSSVALQDVGLLNIKETSAQYFSGVVYIVDIDSTLKSLVLDRQIYM